jgi:hypothetical protein
MPAAVSIRCMFASVLSCRWETQHNRETQQEWVRQHALMPEQPGVNRNHCSSLRLQFALEGQLSEKYVMQLCV